jgi:hypothetical protein
LVSTRDFHAFSSDDVKLSNARLKLQFREVRQKLMDKDKISFKDISEIRVARIGLEEVEEVKNTVGFVDNLTSRGVENLHPSMSADYLHAVLNTNFEPDVKSELFGSFLDGMNVDCLREATIKAGMVPEKAKAKMKSALTGLLDSPEKSRSPRSNLQENLL